MNATALIAEDEPLLAAALQAELARAWPGLQLLATVGNGAAAVTQALALKPQVLFLDIRMPGLSGLEAAVQLAEEWPEGVPGAAPFPAIVFVTAYDQYAVQAFEAQAMDYLLKPVQTARLQKTVAKLQLALRNRMQHIEARNMKRVSEAIDQLAKRGAHHRAAGGARVLRPQLGHLVAIELLAVQQYAGVEFTHGICGVSIIRSGEAMETALRECCQGVKVGKILVHR